MDIKFKSHIFVTAVYCLHQVAYMNCSQQWHLNDDRLANRFLYIHTEWRKSHLTLHLALSFNGSAPLCVCKYRKV